jgi:hypothetical protein
VDVDAVGIWSVEASGGLSASHGVPRRRRRGHHERRVSTWTSTDPVPFLLAPQANAAATKNPARCLGDPVVALLVRSSMAQSRVLP